MNKCEIIAEIGWNWMGDITLAKEMISAAKESGADFAKFQTWSTSRLKPGEWDNDGRRQIYEKAELTIEKHFELLEYCEKLNIKFMSSVFSIEDAKLLFSVQKHFVKIPSFESRNHELIKFCTERFLNTYISVGTSKMTEVQNLIKNKIIYDHPFMDNWTLLHCVSAYPCEPKNANLGRIGLLKDLTSNVGYSDHTKGVDVAKISLEYNPKVIEKHFTIDNNLPGRDNKFAILPYQLKELSDYIKLRNKAHQTISCDYLNIEGKSRQEYTGRFNKG